MLISEIHCTICGTSIQFYLFEEIKNWELQKDDTYLCPTCSFKWGKARVKRKLSQLNEEQSSV